ncbi:hypothetical protein EDB85DRAFT_1886022 [Lactarius pseudohatsudake]|nr:hypothetical protein EDB85DRAFT_1886022 [Lactarius pseudohatsudake]
MCHICLPSLTQNHQHFLLDRNGKMLGHLQVMCTTNRDHADNNNNDRNDTAPSKHADNKERGSMTGDDCTNNDCHLRTVSTSRSMLPTRWSCDYDVNDDSSGRQPTRNTAASPPPRVHPAQLRSNAIYALSGLLKHHTAALALFEAAGGWATLGYDTTTTRARSGSTDSEANAGPRMHPNLHAALVADPGLADTVRAVRNHDNDNDNGSGRQPRVTGTAIMLMTMSRGSYNVQERTINAPELLAEGNQFVDKALTYTQPTVMTRPWRSDGRNGYLDCELMVAAVTCDVVVTTVKFGVQTLPEPNQTYVNLNQTNGPVWGSAKTGSELN